MATAIDKWIVQQNPNSTLKGLGATIVASSQHSNVNPFLIVAIAGKESSLGDPGDYNVSHGNNSFGRTATESQPHFDGAKRWYKWGSAKASVDYLAPENQGAQGGGDMATYLRTQFGDDLDSNSLIDLIQKYAPPSENDTGQYIAQVQQWINELVELAGGTAPTQGSGSSTSGSSCSCSQSIIATAMSYAWPTYHQADYLDMKPEYQTAVSDAASKGWYVGGGEHPGIDCGGFVTIVMRNSGADPNYNSGNCNTTCQKQYLDQHPELYENLGAKSSTDGLEPGDIAINSSHTYFYAGSSGYPGYNALSASFGSWRSPMASTAYFSNGDGSFTWYRVKCPQNQ